MASNKKRRGFKTEVQQLLGLISVDPNPAGSVDQWSPEAIEELRALGYLE